MQQIIDIINKERIFFLYYIIKTSINPNQYTFMSADIPYSGPDYAALFDFTKLTRKFKIHIMIEF